MPHQCTIKQGAIVIYITISKDEIYPALGENLTCTGIFLGWVTFNNALPLACMFWCVASGALSTFDEGHCPIFAEFASLPMICHHLCKKANDRSSLPITVQFGSHKKMYLMASFFHKTTTIFVCLFVLVDANTVMKGSGYPIFQRYRLTS